MGQVQYDRPDGNAVGKNVVPAMVVCMIARRMMPIRLITQGIIILLTYQPGGGSRNRHNYPGGSEFSNHSSLFVPIRASTIQLNQYRKVQLDLLIIELQQQPDRRFRDFKGSAMAHAVRHNKPVGLIRPGYEVR